MVLTVRFQLVYSWVASIMVGGNMTEVDCWDTLVDVPHRQVRYRSAYGHTGAPLGSHGWHTLDFGS
jgi:hypothetical protein